MTPRLRKFALTAHVTSSVGWLGTVAGFLVLAIAAITSRDPAIVRGFYSAMVLTGWYVIVPFCVASLITGLVMSVSTPWGLFRHYWVLVKFLITIVAALILFGFTQTLSYLGELAAGPTLSMGELGNLKQSPLLHSGGGLLALLVSTVLAVYKPWGMTSYGRRKRQIGEPPESGSSTGAPRGLYLLIGFIGLVVLFLVLHLIGGGPRAHLMPSS
jgi:uncharacterized membrane protein